jgi:ATP-binding cassette subfamily C protein CydC
MTRAAPEIAQLLDERSRARATRRLVRPASMVVLAFVFGAALLGLAGWFIASSAVAGLAVASTFSFLFPSAGVQALAWARTLSRYRERISTHSATLDLVGSLRTSLFARALRLPRDRVAELRSSELLGRITVDSDAIENVLLRSSFPIIGAVAALIGTAVLSAIVSPTLAVVAVGGLVLTSVAVVASAQYQAAKPARALVDARAQARRSLIEALDGLPELRSFGAERQAAAAVTGHLKVLGHSRRRLTRLAARGQSTGTLLGDVTLIAVVATTAGLLGTRALSAPAFVAVCLVAIAVFEPVIALPSAVTALARARAASTRLSELFGAGIAGRTGTRTIQSGPWPVAVELEDRDGTLELGKGDLVILTGASGTGKSTIMRAFQGHGTPRVRVHLGGVDAASIDPEVLTQHVTLVSQDAHVFDGTIRENLQLADAAAPESQLWAALAAAALDDTVAALPAGLDTPVGPGGDALSGGQRRRLSVAQGLLRRPDVLLLDEPTEALDTATARRLLAGVRALDTSTALVIALHDRQAQALPWTPTERLHLVAPVSGAAAALALA